MHKSTLIVTLFTLISTVMSTVASANCLPQYQSKLDSLNDTAAVELGAGAASAVVVPVIGAVGGAMSSSAAQSNYSETDQEKTVINLINDANYGSGVTLNQFSKDSSMSIENAAAFIKQSDQTNVFCTNELMSYDDIVALARK